ncbi:MAG: hypothetical protein GX483_01035 [Actinomycetaceae bacterium]|nr:hypothetical protein [Actinomycetaceae bacterium]
MCHKDIIPEFRSQPPILTIALTGARNSGKTVYMVSLVQTLRNMATASSYAFTGMYDTDAHFNSAYYKRIYQDNEAIPATPIEYQKPLFYRIQKQNSAPIYIVIRDIAGEVLQKNDSNDPALHYIPASDLTLFLFDPYTIPSLMNELAGLIPERQGGGIGGEVVLNALLNNLIMPYKGRRTNLALVFSKFDVVQILGETNTSSLPEIMGNKGLSFLVDDTSTRPARWNIEEALILDQDVRSLLVKTEGDEVLLAAEVAFHDTPHKLATFAVSALGNPPGQHYLSEHGVAPFRCADPVMWAFYRKFGRALFS